jgi:hypothetical protein
MLERVIRAVDRTDTQGPMGELLGRQSDVSGTRQVTALRGEVH